jgi:hypothetical protein
MLLTVSCFRSLLYDLAPGSNFDLLEFRNSIHFQKAEQYPYHRHSLFARHSKAQSKSWSYILRILCYYISIPRLLFSISSYLHCAQPLQKLEQVPHAPTSLGDRLP